MKKTIVQIAALLISLMALIVFSLPEPPHRIVEYDIVIPGLTKEYRFLFLTDTHMVLPDNNDSQVEKTYSAQRYLAFLNHEGTSSAEQFQYWIDFANAQELDGVLLGGDIIDSPSDANLEHLEDELSQLSTPFIYALGNHDWTFPWEYMTETGTKKYLPLLEEYMKGNTSIHTLDFEEFSIVAIDNSSNQVNALALEDYKKLLAKNKPVILMMHVPYMTDSLLKKTKNVWKNNPVVIGDGTNGSISANQISAAFYSLTTAKDSPVEAILAGHVHLPESSRIEGEKSIPQFVGDAGFKESGAIIHIYSETMENN